ncbi:hypothetical protein FPOAC2_03603 [Fusarium poae]
MEQAVDTLAITTSRRLRGMESNNLPPIKFIVSEDRKTVLDLYLSHRAAPEISMQSDTETGATNSKKRSREDFEEGDRRAGLRSSNWGPADKTLERWRKVHNFMQKHDCIQSVDDSINKAMAYKQFFTVAASVHRFTGGLIVGNTPFHASHPTQWDDDSHEFLVEFQKCVKAFQNAVIQSFIHRLPGFLLEREWTQSSTISDDQRASAARHHPVETNSYVFQSLFTTNFGNKHPLYRYKVALERCGQTKGLPDSAVRLEQAEALFTDGTASLCGWHSEKAHWIEFIQGLEQDVWIAASMEVKSPDDTQLERQKFVEKFGGENVVNRTSADITFEKEFLQKASQSFMVIQSQWLTGRTRGKTGSTSTIDLSHIDGHNVEVSQRGQIRLSYKSINNQTVTAEFKFGPSVAPLEKGDARTIHFTEHGIDLRTPTGFTLRVPAYNSACTLPLSVMKGREAGRAFVSLWEIIRGRDAAVAASPRPLGASVTDTSDYPEALRASPIGDKGAKPPSKHPGTVRPPNQNDALWLLGRYIDLRLPRGGDFWTGSKDDFPQGTDDVTGFIE